MIYRIGALIGVVGLVLILNHLFPDALGSEDAQMHVLRAALVLTLCAGALVHYRHRLSEGLLHAAAWVGIGAALVLGYSFRDEIAARLHGELLPSALKATGDGNYAVAASDDGHFYLMAEVNGMPVRFMVDTGASDIILPRGVAERLGIALDDLRYIQVFNTANGTTRAASIVLPQLTIGPSSYDDVNAFVSEGGLDTPLLGMSFLRRLRSFRAEGDKLVLSF